MTTLEQIHIKMRKLQVQADALIAKNAQSILNDIHALMAQHGITIADIDAHAGTTRRRGRPVGSKAKAKVTVKVKAQARSTTTPKLPAKYRDPRTGQTWSGWARPPAWIKDVKDRSKFLIAVESTAPKKKPAAKKESIATLALVNKRSDARSKSSTKKNPQATPDFSGPAPASNDPVSALSLAS